MNCKQGDLAVYVGKREDCVGKIVRCVRLTYSGIDGNAGWVIDPPLYEGVRPGNRYPGTFNNGTAVSDRALRPIRNPGDDATDETLEWLPVPSAHNLKEAA